MFELKLVLGEDVCGVLVLVECNEVFLGIVYGFDVVVSKGVNVVVMFLEDLYKKVEYFIVIVEGYKNVIVSVFYDYLKGLQVLVIFKCYGFMMK